MRGTYKSRDPKSMLSLQAIRCAVHDAEVACEDGGILLGRAHHALERDQLELRRQALDLMRSAADDLINAIESLRAKLEGRFASKSARQDAARLRALDAASDAVSQTEPTGARSEASSSKIAGGSLIAPAVASHGGGR